MPDFDIGAYSSGSGLPKKTSVINLVLISETREKKKTKINRVTALIRLWLLTGSDCAGQKAILLKFTEKE